VLDPDLAAARRAVRLATADLPGGSLVLVACSGGADSLALLAAACFELPRTGRRCGAVVVDHALQAGSVAVAQRAAQQARERGADPVHVLTATVGGGAGPEAAARSARYAALRRAAHESEAAAVLLAHTRDDQAETVLLGLARGSGARSLAGMRPADGLWRRPLLGLPRAQVRRACVAAGLSAWEDPHNTDPAYRRARVRSRVLPALEAELGPGVSAALARTADLLRADADLLDELAEPLTRSLAVAGSDLHVDCRLLAGEPVALRSRVLLAAARRVGCPPTHLTAAHVGAMDDLVTGTHGGHGIDLPGGVRAQRRGRALVIGPRSDKGV
jgi:tRNA(Ile)-lysidine synthase